MKNRDIDYGKETGDVHEMDIMFDHTEHEESEIDRLSRRHSEPLYIHY